MMRTRLLLIAVVAAVTASSCSTSSSSVEIGFKRVALDLAFKDEDLALPTPAAQVITQVIPADAYDLGPIPRARTVTRRRVFICHTAPPNEAPQEPAFAVVKKQPKPGVYYRHNTGTITVEAATQSFTLPVPPASTATVSKPRAYTGVAATGDAAESPEVPTEAQGANPVVPLVEFSMTRQLLRGHSVTDTYRYSNKQPAALTTSEATGVKGTVDADYLYLVKRVTVAQGVTKVFTPQPPIRMVRLNVPEGSLVTAGVVHGGIDPATNVAMTVVSQVVQREVVDVCGEVLDTYVVKIQEQFVDLAKTPPQLSGNEGTAATFWNVQFDNGMLIVRERIDTTVRTSAQIAGQPVPITLRYRYVSTLDTPEPEPVAAAQP